MADEEGKALSVLIRMQERVELIETTMRSKSSRHEAAVAESIKTTSEFSF